jgi:hypothetical protein
MSLRELVPLPMKSLAWTLPKNDSGMQLPGVNKPSPLPRRMLNNTPFATDWRRASKPSFPSA